VNFSDFYGLMPFDNPTSIAPNSSIAFPRDGVNSGGGILRISPYEFLLPNIGIYEITFHVSVTEPCQIVIALNATEILSSVVGRATGTSQLFGVSLVQTSIINSIISINNPAGETTAITITPFAGGVLPVSARLIIKQLV
jgi:hypothetical protein